MSDDQNNIAKPPETVEVKKVERPLIPLGRVIDVDLVPEMEKSYLDYAMSVIVARALPDVRDGLKPVHRRIIYAMNQMGLTSGAKSTKSAKVVGEVLGKYHPHGDMSVYMAMVRMAQDFSLRYMLVKGQGNFGSIDGDPPAAMRYTEARLAKITAEMIGDIEKETVDMVDNYDASTQEPSVLPSKTPNLLLNGADGIAVGMATKIPPHNLGELSDAIGHLLQHATVLPNPEKDKPSRPILNTHDKILKEIYNLEEKGYLLESTAKVEDLLEFVQGPDFPTYGEIYGKKFIQEMYLTGRGKFDVRGKAKIEETKSGKIRIVITEIPYQVNKAEMVKKIADLARDKKIVGISDLRDESDRHGIRVVCELKKSANPKSVLNKLYKFTTLQTSYSANMLAIVEGSPQTLNLRQMLLLFLRHREEIVRRRTIFELKGLKIRAHILEGYKIALDNLDEVIRIIRASDTVEVARDNLMKKFDFTDLQANAILEMQLRRLAALERKKIEDEYNALKLEIDRLLGIVTIPEKMIAVLTSENTEVKEKFADERRTKIYVRALEDFSEEDLIPKEDCIVTITRTGYIKRLPKDSYRSQARGGKGVSAMTTKDEDEVDNMLSVTTHDELLYFTNRGRVFKTKVWEVAEGSRQTKGQAVVNLIQIQQGETVQAILPTSKDLPIKYILLATRNGTVKKTALDQFENIRQSGIAAIKLDEKDELVWAKGTSGDDEVFLVTVDGKCIRFSESDARPMGRHTQGVRGIALKSGDHLVSMDIIPNGSHSKTDKSDFRDLFVVSVQGIGKRTDVYQYPQQKRGGVGVKVANVSDKTGKVAAAGVVSPLDEQIILASKKAISIKMELKNIPRLGRNTKGVILMRFKTGDDHVNAMTILKANIQPSK